MILDEPTSVLTPAEADEVLGMLHAMTRQRAVTVLMITHKFREVMAFADAVTVLRRGRLAGEAPPRGHEPGAARGDDGGRARDPAGPRGQDRRGQPPIDEPRLVVDDLVVDNDSGLPAVAHVSLSVRPGEIVGIAGVSGNGQRELVEALIGQRQPRGGRDPRERQALPRDARRDPRCRAFSLPEEPLRNACVPGMSVAENIALRSFDEAAARRGPVAPARPHARARAPPHRGVQGEDRRPRRAHRRRCPAAMSSARCSRASCPGNAAVLIAANPVFGLDFAAVAEIHDRILAARNGGAAVLLVSEDLDELLALSDRILVIFDGRIVHETAGRGRRHRRDRPRAWPATTPAPGRRSGSSSSRAPRVQSADARRSRRSPAPRVASIADWKSLCSCEDSLAASGRHLRVP